MRTIYRTIYAEADFRWFLRLVKRPWGMELDGDRSTNIVPREAQDE